MLRKITSALLKRVYRLTQAGSRHAADAHLERYVLDDFVAGDYGAAYGITRAARARLVAQMQRVLEHVPSATRVLYHVVLARELFAIPPGTAGDVVECGTYRGASAASLSLACALVGRRLWICDSFAGLPTSESEINRDYTHLKLQGRYAQGMYAGALAEVRSNVTAFGDLSRCEFVQGLFGESLRALPPAIAFAFVDVDLTSSMRDCIRHVWPRLVDAGLFYTDDSCDMEVVRVWFDAEWWRNELGQRPPGYVGSGCGLPMSVAGSSLGYARKVADPSRAFATASWLVGEK